MIKRYFFVLFTAALTFGAWAQNNAIISGSVQTESGLVLPGATVFVKGTYVGSGTNEAGKFVIKADQLKFPTTLVVSFLGYETAEISLSQAESELEVTIRPSTPIQVVVVAASRAEEGIAQTPVTINKLNQQQIGQLATPDIIAGLGRLKNVDVLSSSMLTTSFSTRGFNSGLATRVVQLDDYMDTQLPSLNTYLGNTLGTPVLDIASVELVQGPASALYGANAFNGVLLTNSRDPFLDPGLTVRLRGGSQNLLDGQLRYAQKLGKRVAFKIAAGATVAQDFFADNEDPTSLQINGYNRRADSNHGYDAVNRYGDMVIAGGVHMPGYSEQDIVADDDKTHSYKIAPTLAVLLSNSIKATLDYRYANTTTTFQNDGRYRFVNSGTQQGRLQVQGTNWVVRGFSTNELSGNNSRIYNLQTLGSSVQNQLVSPTYINPYTNEPGSYVNRYTSAYVDKYIEIYGVDPAREDEEIAGIARAHANATAPQLQPGTEAFVQARNKSLGSPSPEGALLKTRSTLREASGQYNFKPSFADIIVGGAYRQYLLSSDGTLFEDGKAEENIGNYQYGAYGQASKALFDDRLKLSFAGRLDKFKNFGSAFSPRAAVVYSAGADKQHNFRVNFSRAYRSPTQTDQYIKSDIGELLLVGNVRDALRGYQTRLVDTVVATFNVNDPALYEFRNLPAYEITLPRLKLEEVNGYEAGYRAELGKKLYIDVNYYYNVYHNFITNQTFIGNPDGSSPTPRQLIYSLVFTGFRGEDALNQGDEYKSRLMRAAVNVDQQVRSHGAGIELGYTLSPALTLLGNYSFSDLLTKDFAAGTQSYYNTPRHKFNLGFNGQALANNLSYSLNYRWADSFLFESSFAIGTVPVSQTVDAQVGYTVPKLHTTLQVGATNLFNTTNIQLYGAPQYGRIGYFGLLFDIK